LGSDFSGYTYPQQQCRFVVYVIDHSVCVKGLGIDGLDESLVRLRARFDDTTRFDRHVLLANRPSLELDVSSFGKVVDLALVQKPPHDQ